ncbi:MAG: outer membrane lipoprotein-sorting protein [SAR324 cluster bacterium]|uniref:Outer membrane lipoprotein-sorting protein n=1 Tax=SAR324 cluster bacterium TaxID=2024889 RepID=A0A2A4T647_9DELT|nr:MAG: outer membrane lipoprotein-sorting protein [SAR324 cluster bacterium]
MASSQEEGRDIVKKAVQQDDGYDNSKVDLEMILKNRQGTESKRFMRTRNLEVHNDGDKLLIIFDRPRDVKGTAFLTVTHKTGPDDQWMYLPALKRVKRISSNNKSGPFMGSEFAYEDLASQELEKYAAYNFLKKEPCGEWTCFAVERFPVDKKSGYTRQIVWIDEEYYRFVKIEYYDRKNSLLKTQSNQDFKQYLNQFWRPGEILMVNHQSGKSSTLFFKNYQFQTGLTERYFNKNSLKRAR